MRRNCVSCVLLVSFIACTRAAPGVVRQYQPSAAIYAEYARDANKPMKNGLNRRVFNKREAQQGRDITLNSDGCFTLAPGTYRLTGFSAVTMQTTMGPPSYPNGMNYPGYCMVYPQSVERAAQNDVLKAAIAIGSGATSGEISPSLFDAIHEFTSRTNVCVGHQAGELKDPIYLSIYDVGGIKSDYHVMARVSITKLD
jgi:hypothetical protein